MDYNFLIIALSMAAVIFAIIFKKDKHIFRVQKKETLKFTALALVVFGLRCVLASNAPPEILNEDLVYMLKNMPVWPLFLVFWEDIVFAAPVIYLDRKGYKKLKIVATIAAMVIFGSAHLYQGIFGFFFSAGYLYILSINGGKKYGLGTIMIFHILFDLSALAAVRLML